MLNKLADLMERDQQFLAELESLNGGKGVRIAREMDIADTIGCLRFVQIQLVLSHTRDADSGATDTTPAGRARSLARRSRRRGTSRPIPSLSPSVLPARSFRGTMCVATTLRCGVG